jgi:hypothetical protein
VGQWPLAMSAFGVLPVKYGGLPQSPKVILD